MSLVRLTGDRAFRGLQDLSSMWLVGVLTVAKTVKSPVISGDSHTARCVERGRDGGFPDTCDYKIRGAYATTGGYTVVGTFITVFRQLEVDTEK